MKKAKKSARTLKHQTIMLTSQMLVDMRCCAPGILDVVSAGLVPCEISTDPEENIDLVVKLIHETNRDIYYVVKRRPVANYDRAYTSPAQHLVDDFEVELALGNVPSRWADPWVGAQLLATWADALLTREER